MRKEIREVKKVEKVEVFVADDGREFPTEGLCKRYERNKIRATLFEEIDRLYRVKELDGQIPIHSDACYSDFSTYRWYKVNNKEELKEVEEAYGEPVYNSDNLTYPTYICMETEDEEYNGQPYTYTLDEAKRITNCFFELFGVEVTFNNKED